MDFNLDRTQRIILAKVLSTIVGPRGARSAVRAADAHRTIAPVKRGQNGGAISRQRIMNISNRLDSNPAPQRVLASGNATSIELRQQVCHRCGKAWWPRRPNKPARCPGCKSPYWDRPRRLKHPIMPVKEPVNQMALTKAVGRKMARTLGGGNGNERGKETEDRSWQRHSTYSRR